MSHYLNTIFVTTEGAWVHKDHETIVVEHEGKKLLTVPMHHIGAIMCFGRISVSPYLMHACADANIAISFLTDDGRFLARVEGPPTGNVLLRRTQHRLADDATKRADIVRSVVVGKLANSIALLRRSAREFDDEDRAARLNAAANRIDNALGSASTAADVDRIRGFEGEAAATYFDVFGTMIRADDAAFTFARRSRRPPLDPTNALLSFLYSLLHSDCAGALNAVGLDPAVGFLHTDRPGRLSLALDLMEEFRPALADRLALKLINRRQLCATDFITAPTGAVRLADDARKTVIIEWQKRKQETVQHPFTAEKIPLGMVIHLQARLLARTIRGDIDAYPPFTIR